MRGITCVLVLVAACFNDIWLCKAFWTDTLYV
ncbi:Uncharacterised protein [Budvicia aquatica]|uniref:Uncharacterized protein n=1 Tax=Budvicia aquatica TaxID=82979 RepID=A0A484ZJL9_9GAMM|nr:Uncharacterised protein [Budvicia aquatica]